MEKLNNKRNKSFNPSWFWKKKIEISEPNNRTNEENIMTGIKV